MTRMWVPPSVSQELVEGRQEFKAELEARMVRAHMEKVKGVLDEFNYELNRIDPKLEMVRLDAATDTRGLPIQAGYYHVIRWNDGAAPSVMIVQGEHGEFVEPTSRVFEKLAQQDWWDPANIRLRDQRVELARQAAEKRKVREREERQQEILERWQAGTRTFVSMDRSNPWTQNVNGRRGAKQG